MRAAVVDQPGPADAIRLVDLPVPVPGPTDVLVRVGYTAVNQVDTFIRSGRYRVPMPVPFVIGRDLVGTVERAGDSTGFRSGEAVWSNSLGHGGRQGAAAEFAVVPADRLYRLPDGVDPVRAVTLFHPAATAFVGLHRRAGVRAGQSIFVGGGAGSVGSSVVRFARAAGLRVVATARPADHDRVRALGAEAVFDYADPHVAAQVLRVAAGGVDVCWDTSGRTPLTHLEPILAPGGGMVLTAARGPDRELARWPLYTRDLRIVGFVISRATVPELAEAAEATNRLLTGSEFALRIADVVPLDQVAAAHERVEIGVRGRIAVQVGQPQDSPA
jgi:NADPH:quinone reductase-like Zn-dependent oxidoreductase